MSPASILCRCVDERGKPCPRPIAEDGYCWYCVHMFPCDHSVARISEVTL